MNEKKMKRRVEYVVKVFVNSIKIQIGRWSHEYVVVETNAPESYDGFGSITVQESGGERLVLIQEEHLEWHLCRYSSGLYRHEVLEDLDVGGFEGLLVNRLLRKESES